MKTKSRISTLLVGAFALGLLQLKTAHAADRWWDGGTVNIAVLGNGASGGTAGNWSTAIQNWDQGNGLTHVAWNNAGGDNAIFGGTAGAVTLTSAITAGTLTFNTAGWVPDFTALAAVTNGSCSGVDLSVRPRTDNIGLFYTGYLDVPTNGTYTIYLATDGRAFLRIHDAGVIDADFGYSGGTERSATVKLQAGRHPIRLSYMRGAGGSPSLTLQWSGPGISKQTIPAVNLLHVDTATAQPPIANNDSGTTAANNPITLDVLVNDSVGSGPGTLRIANLSPPRAGSAVTNQAGQIVYTPNAGFLGEDTFAYTATDGTSSVTGMVTVSVFFYDGMVWFPFNQTLGLTTLDAGGAFTGVLNGFASDTTEWILGKWNRAIDFDGVGNYIAISNFGGILGASNRTCAVWVKTTAAGNVPVIAWGPNSTGNKWTLLIQNGHVRVEVTSGYLEGTTLVNDGQWHHVAVTFANDGAPDIIKAKLYIDGIVETTFAASASRTVNTTSSGDVKIGGDVQNRFFPGIIDEPQIYNRALTASEIAALYCATNQSAAAWHRRYFGNAPVNWLADDDGDGSPRLLEYALGTQPWIADTPEWRLSAKIVGNQLLVSFTRRILGTTELAYTPQVSRDLLNWTLGTTFVVASLISTKPGFETATYQADATTTQESAQFIRLAVALP